MSQWLFHRPCHIAPYWNSSRVEGTDLLNSRVRTGFITGSFHAVFIWLTTEFSIDHPLWKLSSRNRVTPVFIQNGVYHGITFMALSTIPAAIGFHAVANAVFGDSAGADANRCDTH